MNTNETPPPVCRHLRTKQMYVPAQAAGAMAKHLHPHDDSFYTCIRTLTALGCDDDAVHPQACCPGRKCYEA
jgi:hypothetical protein